MKSVILISNVVVIGLLLIVALTLTVSAKKEEQVLTPFGWRPSHCHQKVPNGTSLVIREDRVDAIQKDGSVIRFPKQQDCIDFQDKEWERRAKDKEWERSSLKSHHYGDYVKGWLDNAGFFPPSDVVSFSGTYTVPSTPTENGQTLFYFIGIENMNNTGPVSILQPVLQYNQGGYPGWSLASWNCCPQGQTFESSTLTGLQSGDTLNGVVDQSSSSNWTITSTWNGQVATLTVPVAARNFTWCDVTLETYNVTNCAQFPSGPMTFSNLSLSDESGAITPNWTPWAEPTECNGSLTVQSASEIIIQHNNNSLS